MGHSPTCYADLRLRPLVVVITALNEVGKIGTVLDEVPSQTADQPEMVRIVEETGPASPPPSVRCRR